MSRFKSSLPESLAASVKTAVSSWQSGGKVQRLWARDPTLWCLVKNTRLAWLKRRKPAAISKCWRSADGARFVRDVEAGLRAVQKALA